MIKINKVVCFLVVLIVFSSCKKNTLVEVVDVPATPIVAIKADLGTSTANDVVANEGAFQMFKLPFNYRDLEPDFDAVTTEIHYSKHHLGFVNNLNKLVVDTRFVDMSVTDILKNVKLSEIEIRNNAGGFYNHNIFWESIGPNKGGEPEGVLLEAIIRDFGSVDAFKSQFTETSLRFFGAGWSWLVADKYGKLKIVTTQNNDNPLMKGLGISGVPLLTLDLWEHAYYLKFQNRKREYVNTFFSVINWEEAASKYEAFPKSAFPKINAEPITSSTEIVPVAIPDEPINIPNQKPE